MQYHRQGFTLIELALALAITAAVIAVVVGVWPVLDRFGLTRAARVAEVQLQTARLHAVAARVPTVVQLVGGRLEVSERSGRLLATTDLVAVAGGRLDSIRLRPSRWRFNTRGHGSPGSLYLYRGRRGVRLISNFVGRVRAVPFRN